MHDHLPPRDRRQRKRYLTKRNVGIVAALFATLFLGVSLWNETHPKSDDGLALVKERAAREPVELVREAPVVTPRELPSSEDTLWVERPDKEEILGVDPYEQYRADDRYGHLESERVSGELEPPALSFRGTDQPFIDQRSGRSTSRIKISGTGSALTLEKDDEGR